MEQTLLEKIICSPGTIASRIFAKEKKFEPRGMNVLIRLNGRLRSPTPPGFVFTLSDPRHLNVHSFST